MDRLCQDVQIIIFTYLNPLDVISFCNSSILFETIINDLSNHVAFVIKCKGFVERNHLEWFKQKNIVEIFQLLRQVFIIL